MWCLQVDFPAEGVDLYDDIGVPTDSGAPGVGVGDGSSISRDGSSGATSNGVYHQSGSLTPNHLGRRFQLYIGNLTWVCDVSFCE